MTELRNLNLGRGDLIRDAWGVPKVSLPVSVFHGNWTFDIPASMWFMYENSVQVYASTNIVSVNGHAKLLADAANTVVKLESRECPRYQPNRGHLFSTAGWFPNKTADGVREWGLLNDTNGVFFRLKSDGLLYAVLLSGGVESEHLIPEANLPADFNVELNNVYDIQYQWGSAGDYYFYVVDATSSTPKLVYHLQHLNTVAAVSMENPALPAGFKATRTTEDVEMHIGCADITSENGIADMEQYNSAYAESITISTDTPVIVIKQPALITTKTNTRTISLARVTVNCSKKANFKVWVTRDPAAIVGATFVALGSGSFVETDSPDMNAGAVRATSVVTASMKFVTAVQVEALTSEHVDNPHPSSINFTLVRGDYLVVTGTASSGIADAVVEWGEQV